MIEGRSFRFVRYRHGSFDHRTYVARFAWFPEDIARTHIYYRFAEIVDWISFGRPKMAELDAMLRKFRFDDPVAAATGPDGALLRATVKGDADAVARALVDGASPNARAGRVGALAGAAFYGHAAIVRLLLAKGADVGLRNQYGVTALMLAGLSRDTPRSQKTCSAPGPTSTPAPKTAAPRGWRPPRRDTVLSVTTRWKSNSIRV